ncbi:carbohydrate ABC transporter permease [Auraticoccus monumenti]|uniref:Carbohydrate ABC transporter membrane protein 1, CUT1 family n=1 Tax=Auraticoccus monumenti TaxID=675864 RepID=A0A1G6XKA6_9ACTN|nr:sugar ABC transporter permease [Auraticoccus monumenti]SDD77795.1 carbohydrate ABC transporter membrane protein 1, CUT1 family [Auraticoccus monumenti]
MTDVAFTERVRRARAGVAPGGSGRQQDRRPARRGPSARTLTLLLLVTPSVLLIALLNLYPVLYGTMQSLRNGTLISAGDFVGLDNFRRVLTSPGFWAAARFTLLFTLVGVFGSWLVGLALALLLRTRIPAGRVFKVLLLLPWVVPVVVSSTSWNWLVATPQSPLPILVDALGLPRLLFLADPLLATITVCLFKVWISFPFMMMMMSASLAAVDENVYEAGRVDGASRRQLFTHLTLPLISRSTYISWILMTIFCVNDFPTIFLLTGGGPVNATTSLVVLSYRTTFAQYQTGPGTAIALLMTITLVIISVVLYRQIRKVDIA